jgi:predicted membrane protein
MKKNNINKLDYFNLELNNFHIRILLIIIIILIIFLLFRQIFNIIIEKIILFVVLFILFLVITRNLVITFIGASIIFLLINLIISYRTTIEKFENDIVNNEPEFNKNIFSDDTFKKSSEGIQELLKKMNGGIELKEDDTKETEILNIDTKKYSDDKIPNALKDAQKETYELMNTVNALKDTISTLAPVLQEGKKIMSMFENLKI